LSSEAYKADPFIVRTYGIPSAQSVASEPSNHPEMSLFTGIIPSLPKSTRNARKHNRKKHQARHLISEENIRDSSEKRRLKIERENTAKEQMKSEE
jgi:hypothetical protein